MQYFFLYSFVGFCFICWLWSDRNRQRRQDNLGTNHFDTRYGMVGLGDWTIALLFWPIILLGLAMGVIAKVTDRGND